MEKRKIRALLQEEGLSENASRVYLSLVLEGSGNLSTISSFTGLHPQSVKNALRELDRLGFISRVGHKLSRSLYHPAPPYILSQRLKSRYDRYVTMLPALQNAYRAKTARFSSVYRGATAFREHLTQLVSEMVKGDTLSIIGHPGERLKTWLDDRYEQIEGTRLARGIGKKVIVSYRDVHAFTEQKEFLSERSSDYRKHVAIEGPLIQFITKDKVLYHFSDQSEPTTHIISSNTHAKGAMRLFGHLWKGSSHLL